jgi:probable selenium-dependent hydroxylase accessory protein YqeC
MTAVDLYEAFGLSPGAIVAAVGGGGKTSLVFGLAEDAASRGMSAIVTSTTRFTRPPHGSMPPVVTTDDGSAVRAAREALKTESVFVLCAGMGSRGRFLGLQPETIGALAQVGAGVIAVEADGSAHRPFKAPADHEPAVPAVATDVVLCVGLEVLGKPLDDRYVHRPELVARLARATAGTPVTADMIISVLLDEAGGRKNVPPGARLHALLNAPPTDEHVKLGTYIAQRVVFGGYCRAVIATAHRRGDVVAVVQ